MGVMRVEAAKTKWCPMMRSSSREEDANASNAGVADKNKVPEFAKCVADGCAMWRWHQSEQGYRMDTGYCGLAGKE